MSVCDRCADLRVVYINLARHTERAAHMERMLRAAQPSCSRTPLIERIEAVAPVCVHGKACKLGGNASVFSEHSVSLLERSLTRHYTSDARRSGAVGAWLSHVSAWKRFAAGGESGSALLLLLEDDVWLDRTFFAQLPCLLSRVPNEPPWHAIRFSTWGARFEDDRLDGDVYRASSHAYDGSGQAAFAYGGAHAVLVQRRTVGELLAYATGNGIRPIDVALRDAQHHGGHTRNHSAPAHASGSRADAVPTAPAPRAIRSYVLFTPLVNLSHLVGWRAAVTR